jgi:hypothetical protein
MRYSQSPRVGKAPTLGHPPSVWKDTGALSMEDVQEELSGGDAHDDFAQSIGVSSAALDEVLDGIEHRSTLQYIRRTLRTQYETTLNNKQWTAIKEFSAKTKRMSDE